MSALNTYLLVILVILNGKLILSRQCPDDAIDFATKVENSSIVVYGSVEGKEAVANSRSIDNIKFRVDCILKGPALPRQIIISQLDRSERKASCQRFSNLWAKFVAFLEVSSNNDTTLYTPSSFTEVTFEVDEDTNELSHDLLINTCDLQKTEPIDESPSVSLNSTCPAVSTNSSCIKTTLKPKIENANGAADLTLKVVPGGSQLGMDEVRGRSGNFQVDIDKRNQAGSIIVNGFLILMAISLAQLN